MRAVLFTISIICAIIESHATTYPNTYYADMQCGGTVFISQSARFKLSYQSQLQPNTQCVTSLRSAITGNILVAKFRDYYMSPHYVTPGTCFVESILLGSASTPQIFGPYGYCKSSRPSRRYELGFYGTFGFKTWPYSMIEPASVDLLVTSMATKSGGVCPVGYFDCKTREGYCVDEELTCNGYDDCGNNRDEIEGCGLSTGIIAGIAAGVFVFIVVVVVLSLLFRRHRRRVAYVQYN